MDSRQFVVFSDRPSTPYSPRRCSVRVSSSPSFRLPAADWFLQLATQRLEVERRPLAVYEEVASCSERPSSTG